MKITTLSNKVHIPEIMPEEDINSTYDSRVSEFKKRVQGIQSQTLTFLWELGVFVNTLMMTTKYGTRTVEALAEELGEPGMQKSDLYKFARFATVYSKEEMAAISTKGYTWFTVQQLIRIKDAKQRKMLEAGLDSGQIKPTKLQGAVSEINKELSSEETPSEGSPEKDASKGKEDAPNFAICKKCNSLLRSFVETSKRCAKDIDALALLDEGARRKVAEDLGEFAATLEDAQIRITQVIELLKKNNI